MSSKLQAMTTLAPQVPNGADSSEGTITVLGARARTPVESLLAILVISQLIFLPLDFAEVGLTSDGGPDVIRLGLLTLGGLLPILPILFLVYRRRDYQPSSATAMLGLWIAWGGLGLFTSVDVRQTALSVAFMTGNLVGFTWFSYRFGRRAIAMAHVLALSVFIAVGLVSDLIGGFDDGRMDGLSPSINGFAMTAVVLLAWTMILRRYRAESWQLASVGVAVTAVLASGSRASIASVVLIALVLGKWPRRSVLVLHAAAVAAVLILVATFGVVDVERTSADGSETVVSLTGRSDVWDSALSLIEQRPVMGYGIHAGDAIWTNEYLRTRVGFKAGNAHNSWLEIAVSTGLVGLGWFVGATFLAVAAVLKQRDRGLALLALLILVILGSTEALLDGPSLGFIQLVVICAAGGDPHRSLVLIGLNERKNGDGRAR